MDDKVVDWVAKAVDKEYKQNRKKYDAFGGVFLGRVIATSVVNDRLLKYMGRQGKAINGTPKARFIIAAQEYADRFENYFYEDDCVQSDARLRVLIEKNKKSKKGKIKNERKITYERNYAK